jgi:hypothetical protein
MTETYISNILETATFGNDLPTQLGDYVRRMGSIDAECPLDLASTDDFFLPIENLDQLY